MKLILSNIVLALVITSQATISRTDLSNYDYHWRYGIPRAAKILRLEEKALTANKVNIQRIVGGRFTDISEVPYQVGLLISVQLLFVSVCGGSLITDTHIVTAAHCHSDGIITVVLGSNFLFSGGVRVDTRDITIHPDWSLETVRNDIAIIRIKLVTFSNVIQPIALPSNTDLSKDFNGQTGLASGFGVTSNSDAITEAQSLSSVLLDIISNTVCSSVYGSWIDDNNICTSGEGGLGTCRGDSGGPLVVDNGQEKILVGITSFGLEAGCELGYPAAYVRITSYLSWILSFIEE